MARRNIRAASLPLCTFACSCRPSRLQSDGGPPRRVAADRMAQGRGPADQILVLDPSGKNLAHASGRPHQAALAHRARLPGPQARDRPWAFRRPWLARLSPSRHALHRRLRLFDFRAGNDSPLGPAFRRALPNASSFPGLSTPRLCHCAPSVISRTRLRRCDGVWLSRSPTNSRDVPAAPDPSEKQDPEIYDAVRLVYCL